MIPTWGHKLEATVIKTNDWKIEPCIEIVDTFSS